MYDSKDTLIMMYSLVIRLFCTLEYIVIHYNITKYSLKNVHKVESTPK